MRRKIFNVVKTIATDPVLLNRIAPVCYLFALIGIAGFGVFRAIPYVYSEYSSWVTSIVQTIGCFLALELFVNWICLVFVDSTYNPEKYGDPPVLFNTGLQTFQQEVSLRANTTKSRKDSSILKMDSDHQYNGYQDVFQQQQTGVDQSVMAYYTWTHCIPCNRPNPPRSHHCVLCNTCILKRDHHCYVAATCVGFRNLRYFIVFLFYAVLATIFSTVHALPYAYVKVIPNVRFYDLFYPVTICRGFLGYVKFTDGILIILGWMLLVYLIFSTVSLFTAYTWIISGNTSYEIQNKIQIYDTRDFTGKIRSVFGCYWLLNFLVPLHFVYEPIDDPIRWPSFKMRGLSLSS